MSTLPITGFDFQPRTRLVFGTNAIDRLGELAGSLSLRRVLIVTDSGIAAAGHVERALHSIESASIRGSVFDRVHENPTTDDVDACLAAARAADIDGIIGLGGGSSIDTAKGCNFVLTNGGRMQDYWGTGKATQPMLPLIAVPTTAGTGSECQSFALIADAETHQKMACGDPKAAPRIALLDPTLTLSQPRNVTACTGIDAIAHAVETAVTKRRNDISWLYSRESFRLTINSFERVLDDPGDLEARANMLLGASFAGIAIENSMLGAAHSAANPLTAHYGVVHGQAVGMMLPHVVRYNAQEPAARQAYCELARHAGLPDSFDALIQCLGRALTAAGFPDGLGDAAIPESAPGELAAEAAGQWTANFNPRTVDAADFESLYAAAM